MTSKTNLLSILLLFISIGLLVPGVTQPMLTITGTMDKAKLKDTGIDILADSMVSGQSDDPQQQAAAKERVKQMIGGVTMMLGMSNISGEIEAYQKTRSIVGTVEDLYNSGNAVVAFLVGLFSVVIPTIKLLMTTVAIWMRNQLKKQTLVTINSLLSKWSMADVFVVATIVTYMAANASSNTGLLEFQSAFEVGFYYFVGYCVFSIFASQLMQYTMKATFARTTPNNYKKAPEQKSPV